MYILNVYLNRDIHCRTSYIHCGTSYNAVQCIYPMQYNVYTHCSTMYIPNVYEVQCTPMYIHNVTQCIYSMYIGFNAVQCIYPCSTMYIPNVYEVQCTPMYIHNVTQCIYSMYIGFNAVQCISTAVQCICIQVAYIHCGTSSYTLCNMIEHLWNVLQCIYPMLPNVYVSYMHVPQCIFMSSNVYTCVPMYMRVSQCICAIYIG